MTAYFPGDRRTRFAFLPVRLWRMDKHGFWVPGQWRWWRRVNEVMTVLEGWRAYEHEQD